MTSVAGRPAISGHDVLRLDAGWEVAAAAPSQAGAHDPLTALDALDWLPAFVPGTVAGAFRAAGQPIPPMDETDWWFRVRFEAAPRADGEEVLLRLGGLATVADVFLNGGLNLESASMFQSHVVDVGAQLRGRNTLAIRFRALAPLLATPRRPRARWRTRLVADNNLRWFRTTLHGRIPGFSAGPPIVGPWRPIQLERRRRIALDRVATRTRLDGPDGVVALDLAGRVLSGAMPDRATVSADGPSGRTEATLPIRPGPDSAFRIDGEIRVPSVEPWWPHTHGTPARYGVTIRIETPDDSEALEIDAGRVGFRTLAPGPNADHDLDRDGLFVHVNGVPVFARGALWTPSDVMTLDATRERLRADLELVRAAGMNMLRVPGFGMYEQDAFHELCDELGILVWQDLMFASMDYPFGDPAFGEVASREVDEVADRLAGHPSTAVICGNSEVLQQVAMLGLDLGLVRLPFYHEIAPARVRAAGSDAIYVAGAPSGAMPLRADQGVSNYYAVGGYRAPLSDARTSGVRFASESLAFANVPDDDLLASLVPEPPGDPFVHHPRWKAGVPRDSGSGWDFDDLRDDYLVRLFGVEPRTLRRGGHDRYVQLSRAVSGEVMAAVFGEWRRAASPSGGGLILWLRDVVPGAGWGVIDVRGRPKAAWSYLRRVLAPVAVWLTDEGTGGIVAHVANDRGQALDARLRIALYTDHELPVGGAEVAVRLAPHETTAVDLEVALGRFVDIAWAFRFGPPAQDVVVVTLEDSRADGRLLSQAFHFPAGRPLAQEPPTRLGLTATIVDHAGDRARLEIASRRVAYGVRIDVPGWASSDDAFSVEPGGRRVVELTRIAGLRGAGGAPEGALSALNLLGLVPIRPSSTSGDGVEPGGQPA